MVSITPGHVIGPQRSAYFHRVLSGNADAKHLRSWLYPSHFPGWDAVPAPQMNFSSQLKL